MKKNNLKGIYAVTPDGLNVETLYKKVHKLLEKGVNLLQYRDKLRSPKEKLIIVPLRSRFGVKMWPFW